MVLADRYVVHSVAKAFALLEAMHRAEGADGLRMIDLSRATGLPKGMAFKLLGTLEDLGYVQRDPETGRYRLGLKLFALGAGAVGPAAVQRDLHALLQQLAAETNETAHMAVLAGGEVLYLDKVESQASLRLVTAIGGRRPAYCTGTGKALLAWRPAEEVRRLVGERLQPFTPKTHTGVEALLAELALVRERGYAVDDEENEPGIVCVGAPVRDDVGTVVAALSVSGPSVRIRPDQIPKLGTQVMAAARRMTETLGPALRTTAWRWM